MSTPDLPWLAPAPPPPPKRKRKLSTSAKIGAGLGALAVWGLAASSLHNTGTSGATESPATTAAPYSSKWLEPNTLAADAVDAARNACQEDDPCWDCATMGNRQCSAPSTEAPTTSSAPVVDERALDLEWILGDGGADADKLSGISDAFGAASEAGDVSAAIDQCGELEFAARDFGAHAPDTATGREAKAAAGLIVKAAQSCIAYDFDTATGYLEQAGPHLDAVVSSIQATIGG